MKSYLAQATNTASWIAYSVVLTPGTITKKIQVVVIGCYGISP